MKRLLIAILTFGIGVFAFSLLSFEKGSIGQEFTQVQKIVEVPKNHVVSLSTSQIPDAKPFFDSFDDDSSDYKGYSGWFIADNFKGMPEVWTILLSRDSESEKNDRLVWSAIILTKNPDDTPNDDADFSSIWIKTENNKLSFKTKKYHNVEYRFEGEFFRKGKTFAEEEKVLKGNLQKFVKGKKVAEFTSDFAYFEPRCFH